MGEWDSPKVEKRINELVKSEVTSVDPDKAIQKHLEQKPNLPLEKVQVKDDEEQDTTVIDEKTGQFLEMQTRKDRPVEIRRFKPEELGQRAGLKLLVFGKEKTGKTTIGLSGEQPIYIIDTENGIKPLIDLHKGKDYTIYDVIRSDTKNFLHIDETATIEVFGASMAEIRNKVLEYNQRTGKFATIVIDSLSTMWDIMLQWLNVEVLRADGKINKKDVPADRRDWKKLNRLYSGLLVQLMNMPAHVILIAQAKEVFDSEDVSDLALGKEAPRVQKWTPHQVDAVIKTFTDGNRYFGQVWVSRYPKLKKGEIIENPTLQKIVDKVR